MKFVSFWAPLAGGPHLELKRGKFVKKKIDENWKMTSKKFKKKTKATNISVTL